MGGGGGGGLSGLQGVDFETDRGGGQVENPIGYLGGFLQFSGSTISCYRGCCPPVDPRWVCGKQKSVFRER